MSSATSATAEAAAALSDVPVTLGDPVMGAICHLETMTSPSKAIEPVDFLRNDHVGFVNGETGTLAILNTQGKYGCTGPYFNMIENADNNNFKRMKVLFELKLLKENDPLYPAEAQEAFAATWILFGILCDEVEEKRNTAVTEFWRAQDVLVVTLDPLFEGMGDPSKIDTPKISRSQISSRAGLLSLLKSPGMRWFLNGNTTVISVESATIKRLQAMSGGLGRLSPWSELDISNNGSTGLAKLALQAMPDLYGRYTNLIAHHPHLKSMTVTPPNICDQNGAIVLPSDYLMKLGNQTPVFIMVKLRLWESSPQSEEKRATSGFKSREGEENGSRMYQLVLHEMTLLPSNIPAYNLIPHKETNIEYPNGNEKTVTQASIGLGSRRKWVFGGFDADNRIVGNPKKICLVTEDSNIEMTNNDVFT
ncbi:hypothetical protein BYT27DRAFT_7215835 [Phlegmacium glaucopus]|nr:hypothetical protein BYT27DRAFT_7215835 [Phlegmacium glaucopus]